MRVAWLPGSLAPLLGPSAVTIGTFDGVHRGHRRLLEHLVERARTAGLVATAVTFDRHPAEVVRPDRVPSLLAELDTKLERLGAVGLEQCLVVHFDAGRSRQGAAAFAGEVLRGVLGARLVVVGRDFHFGRGREGDVDALRAIGQREGFVVEGLELFGEAGAALSSTRIRALVASGDVEQATVLLGRPPSVVARVVRGDRRGGSELGYPTANLEVDPRWCVPPIGIYAGVARLAGGRETWPAAISLGRRPTFYDEAGPLLLEAYLLGFDGDLYGRRLEVGFVARLRDEKRFEDAQALRAQMALDVEQTASAVGAAVRSGRLEPFLAGASLAGSANAGSLVPSPSDGDDLGRARSGEGTGEKK
jgi:riboflavin kinase/FMN adenylyltransferase